MEDAKDTNFYRKTAERIQNQINPMWNIIDYILDKTIIRKKKYCEYVFTDTASENLN